MNSIAAIGRTIRAEWGAIMRRARERGFTALAPRLPARKIRLLGTSVKILKGEKKGILSAVMYLSPSDESGRNLCPWSTAECRAVCLGHSAGKMTMSDSRNARLWKTALYLGSRRLFWSLLDAETEAHQARAEHAGMVPAIRLDGPSDLGLASRMAPRFPGIEWYDYTKSAKRAREALAHQNWHVTLSYSGSNDDAALAHLRDGGNVAVIFRGGLPQRWKRWRVVDGDESDARFLDASPRVVGLALKGISLARAEALAGAFAV